MQLNVLPNHPASARPQAPATTDAQRDALAHDLSLLLRGEVRFSRHDRQLYSTDASIYQVEPIGVLVPADTADALAAIDFCHARSVAMLPRGGGTSLAGQCTNHAVVLDLGARCRALLNLDTEHRWAEVEPGITVDALNLELLSRKSGLFFAPDPATTAQAAIGGCIGNNAAGSRSVKYGRTSENLLAIDAALADGRRVRFEANAGATNPLARDLAARVIDITRRHERLIRERFPKTLRQNAGYGLDRILKQLDAGATAESLDLAQLLCGSEGTLAVTLAARLKLHPLPKAKGLVLLAFPSVDAAIAAVVPILATAPSAIELVDDVVIEAARGNLECSRYVDAFPRVGDRDPAAVLYVEYHEPSDDALRARFADLRRVVSNSGGGGGVEVPRRELTEPGPMADAWKLRKAGEPLLHGLPGNRKPLTFVEDNAVPPERLAEFVREFRAIVQREGTRAAFWAHASVGVLHVRPLLDPHDPADVERLKRIAVDVADLAKRCGGVMSGEHGDGRVRGPLLERFFGPELLAAFREVKAVFDPKNLLNPGNIVAPGPIDSIVERTRIQPDPAGPAHSGPSVPHVETFYSYDDHHGFDGAVERCNGAGVCRKTSGGTMCPSYRGTLDERHSTRGRGNALRLAITGQAPGGESSTPRWSDPDTIATLDLCLACKACKSECPSNVDIARLKAEYTAQRYRSGARLPLASRLIGHVRTLNRLGSLTPRLANWTNNLPPVRALINLVMGLHADRSLPPFTKSLYSTFHAAHAPVPADAPRLALFADCFTTYNESPIGLAAVRVLSKAGYRVELPRSGCCARSMISVGMLPQAIDTIDSTLADLAPVIDDPSVRAVLVAEPSCLSAIKDDWLQLNCRTPIERRRALAAKAMLIEEFLDKHWDAHPNQRLLESAAHRACQGDDPVLLHAHCHQKALWGASTSSALLKRFLNNRLRTPDTGCCGMAGSFGYAREKFNLSMTIANLPGSGGGIIPHVRALPSEATTLATGTSCRHQIKDATAGTCKPLHPIELIDRLIP
jgi:FAD/FMN-containing dehydrogenase/Fe-S oxidoreductase